MASGARSSMPLAPRAVSRRFSLSVGLVLSLALLALLTLSGCSGATPGAPQLPPGFERGWLPGVDVRGYIHVAPGRTVDLPLALLGEGPHESDYVAAERLVVLLGDDIQRYAASIELTDEQGAGLVRRTVEPKAGVVDLRLASEDQRLLVVHGDGAWAAALENEWHSGEGGALSERYPGVWEAMRLLPSDPPASPVAAGFLRDATALAEALLQQWGIEVPGLGSALDLLRVKEAAFVVYADRLQAIPTDVSDDAVAQAGLGLVTVARAGYPGAVVATLVDNFASLAGLRETTVGEEKVQYRDVGGTVHLMVVPIGSDLFFALSPTRDGAQRLIEAVLAGQA